MGVAPIPRFTVEEYLELDRKAELPSEFHDGEICPIESSTVEHAQIVPNVTKALLSSLDTGQCKVLASSVRVRVSRTNYVYPDVFVVCGKFEFTDEKVDTVTNPKVVIEVLSPTTANYDYGGKFAFYRRLPSLVEYLLVEQGEPKVEVFRKQPDDSWVLKTYDGMGAIVPVTSLEIELPLADIYKGIAFDA
ncbi:MAG: Uma2 family endonuclease [Acidobacteria bacterium]|nr:Uma2 family endonuclease [Acidobacteriota bacterium]